MAESSKSISSRIAGFDDLPDAAMVDVRAVAQLHGTSIPTAWRWTRAGRLPPPVKLSPGATRWNVGELRRHRAKQTPEAA